MVFALGFPILLCATAFFAARFPLPLAILFALSAGAVADALSSLPIMMTACFGVLMVLAVRFSRLPRVTVICAYPLYQLWLSIWTNAVGASVFTRLLGAVPLAAVTVWAVMGILGWCERKGALNEAG